LPGLVVYQRLAYRVACHHAGPLEAGGRPATSASYGFRALEAAS
jgi:hypothetical protein